MSFPTTNASKVILILFFALACGGCGRKAKVAPPKPAPVPPRSVKARPQPLPSKPPSPAATPVVPSPRTEVTPPMPAPQPILTLANPGPPIRIGITTTAREVRISGAGEFYLTEKTPEARRQVVEGEVQVRVERGDEQNGEIFRVQVATLSKRDAAENLARQLTEMFSLPAGVRDNPDNRLYQVRVGEFADREEAKSFADGPLRAAGYGRTLVIREAAPSGRGDLKLAARGRDIFRVSSAGFLFQPSSSASYLRLDGKPYRGNFDLQLNKNGSVTVVNQLGTEEYLLGVVPAEMSPHTYPEFAALAAQSIAARTYALKNLGRFSAEGFDLTADVRSQVYGGIAQERDGASEAVRSTFGMAVYYQGRLIDAMYSSTCGGRTEDFANVFETPPVPYLRSVACTAENGIVDGRDATIEGQHDLEQPLFAEDGTTCNRHLELARVLGLPGKDRLDAQNLLESAGAGELKNWVSSAVRVAAGNPDAESREKSFTTRAGFVRYAAERLLGSAEVDRRITPRDAEYYLNNLKDGSLVPAAARRAVSLALQAGLLRPYPDNTIRPAEPIRRADALSLLLRWTESIRPEILRTGLFESRDSAGGNGGQDLFLVVKWGSKTQRFPLSGDVRLYKSGDGRTTPAQNLNLIGNEKLKFHVDPDGKVDFLEAELNPAGAASDRFSPLANWQSTMLRAAIAEKLRPLTGDIGTVLDLRPARLGESGRAVQIQVVGSRRSVTLNGYKVRNALGLRDTLFTIRRTHDPSGAVESFTFDGKGWGHGVGMCQVGAYGMARAGRTYEEILKTYYQGVELRKAY